VKELIEMEKKRVAKIVKTTVAYLSFFLSVKRNNTGSSSLGKYWNHTSPQKMKTSLQSFHFSVLYKSL